MCTDKDNDKNEKNLLPPPLQLQAFSLFVLTVL